MICTERHFGVLYATAPLWEQGNRIISVCLFLKTAAVECSGAVSAVKFGAEISRLCLYSSEFWLKQTRSREGSRVTRTCTVLASHSVSLKVSPFDK